MHNRSSSTDESWDERRSMHRKHLLVLETMCCWFRRVETFLHDVAASTNALGRTRQTTTATNLWANRKWDVNYKHLHLTMSWNVLIWNRYRWALFFFWLVVLIVWCKVFGQSSWSEYVHLLPSRRGEPSSAKFEIHVYLGIFFWWQTDL